MSGPYRSATGSLGIGKNGIVRFCTVTPASAIMEGEPEKTANRVETGKKGHHRTCMQGEVARK